MLLRFLGNHRRKLAEILATMEHDKESHIATLEERAQFDAEVDDPRRGQRHARGAAALRSSGMELDHQKARVASGGYY